jgi:2-methylcitrate dehydratase PrpD
LSTFASVLSRHVLGLRHEDVPPDVRRHAVTLVTDALGNGIYGTTTPQGEAIFREARVRYRDEGTPVWGRGGVRLEPAGAALVNAAQAHAYELDDYVPAGKTHPGTVIVPVAFAVADEDTTGEELITAIVAAYDVMARVSFAMNPNSTRARGFHLTGLTGPFGATAVAGRLLGLDEETLMSAFGLAASCSAGIFAFSAEGAMTKPLHAGRAAEAGIVAARLAREGLQGPTAALEAEDGGLLNAVSDDPRVDELTRDLGTRFDLAQTAIKPYPCCGSIHSSIDAVLELQGEHGFSASDVEAIDVLNAQGVLLQCGFEYSAQGGALEAQMSLQYCLAAALVDGAVGLGQFTVERRRAPEIVALAGRVRFQVDEEIDRLYPTKFAAHVRIHLTNGTVLVSRVPSPLGTPDHPIGADALRAKFTDVTGSLISPPDRDRILDLMADLDHPSPVGPVLATLSEAAPVDSPAPLGNGVRP